MGVFVFQKQRWKHRRSVRFFERSTGNAVAVFVFRNQHSKHRNSVSFSKLTLETPWAVLDFQKQCSRGPSSIGLSKATLETAQQCCLLKPLMATALVTVTWCNVRSLYRRNK